jgi:hypothetical protein
MSISGTRVARKLDRLLLHAAAVDELIGDEVRKPRIKSALLGKFDGFSVREHGPSLFDAPAGSYRSRSIAALVIVVCACSGAPRSQDLAAFSLEAERTYPFSNEAFMSDQSMLMQGRRSNYVKTCMEARGYNYTQTDCNPLDTEAKYLRCVGDFRKRPETRQRGNPAKKTVRWLAN